MTWYLIHLIGIKKQISVEFFDFSNNKFDLVLDSIQMLKRLGLDMSLNWISESLMICILIYKDSSFS